MEKYCLKLTADETNKVMNLIIERITLLEGRRKKYIRDYYVKGCDKVIEAFDKTINENKQLRDTLFERMGNEDNN